MDMEDAIFRYIIMYKRTMDGNSPTVRMIAEALDLPATTVFYCLQALEERQLIRRVPYTRAICIPNGHWTWGEESPHATHVPA